MSGNLLAELLERRLLISTGVDGLYGRSGAFESVVAGLEAVIVRAGTGDGAEIVRFPPAISRHQFQQSGYMKNFPQLAGTVHSFCGGDSEHQLLLEKMEAGEEWPGAQTDLVLVPAACYPVYPMIAAQGVVARSGRLFDIQSYCFRHEPSTDPARMQFFRMREFVKAGTPQDVLDFREMWIARGSALVAELGLPFEVVPANDPFFGRAGRLMKASQRELELKLELVIPVAAEQPTACLSFNYHIDHFSEVWGLHFEGGERVHTGCVGFGLERLTLALFRHHGFDLSNWPSPVRRMLWG